MSESFADDVERRIAGAIGRLPVTRAARWLSFVPLLIGPPMVAAGLCLYLRYTGRATSEERVSLDWTMLICAVNIVLSGAVWVSFATEAFATLNWLIHTLLLAPQGPGDTGGQFHSI